MIKGYLKKRDRSPSRINKPLKIICGVLLFIFLAVYFLKPVETEDVWWHLAAGRFIAQNHHVPDADPFSFDSQKVPWTLTQWLGSLSYYAIYHWGGLTGLRLFRVALFLVVLLLFCGYARGKIPGSILMGLVFLMAFGLEKRAHLRPDAFNYIFLQILIILLLKHWQGGEAKYLWLIPVLSVVWFNFHLGCFVYGLSILSIFLLAGIFEHLKFVIGRADLKKDQDLHRRRTAGLFLTTVLFIVMMIVNPYGLKGALYPFRVFLDPQFIYFYDFAKIITEMKPPPYFWSLEGTWFILLTATSLVSFIFRKKRDVLLALLSIAAFAGFIQSRRLAALFALISGYVIVQNLLGIQRERKWRLAPGFENGIYFLLTGILATAIVRIVNTGYYQDGRWNSRVEMAESHFSPRQHIQILNEIKAEGGVFNSNILGGYVIFNSFPKLKPFVDGRQLDIEAYMLSGKAVYFPRYYWKIAQGEYPFNIILITVKDNVFSEFLRYVLGSGQWQLISIDGLNVLLVKRGIFDLPPGLAGFEQKLKDTVLDENGIRLILQRPSPPRNAFGKIKEFIQPYPLFIDSAAEGKILYELGFKNAGIQRIVETFKVLDMPELRSVLKRCQSPF